MSLPAPLVSIEPIYPRGLVGVSGDNTDSAANTVDKGTADAETSLSTYVEICRVLVRSSSGSTRQSEEVLAAYCLTANRWALLKARWSARISADPALRAEFRRLYAAPPTDRMSVNE